jgi:hypothetical protein
LREGVVVESRGDDDPTAVGNDEFEVGLGGRDRRGRIGQDGDRQGPATTAKFGEITGEPGRSGRRPPRPQSLRPRNSSGSVTS